MSRVPSKYKSGYQKRKEKEENCKVIEKDSVSNGCDNSSAASAVSGLDARFN